MAQSLSLIQNNFTSGEVSPLLEGLIGTPKYLTGLRTCENFLAMRQGCLRKRDGTYYLGATQSNARARLEFLRASDGNPYIIEFTALVIRIWDATAKTVSASTIVSPYALADLPGLRVCGIRGSLWIVSRSYSPRKLSLSGTWSLTTPSYTVTGLRANMFTSSGNYPGAVAYHQGRLVFAGTANDPNGIFLSKAPDASNPETNLTNFAQGTSASDAISLFDDDVNGHAITWLAAIHRLIAATDTTIWIDSGAVATPAAFDGDTNTYGGAADIQGQLADSNAVYLGRGGKSLHLLVYTSNTDYPGFTDYDISEASNHILKSGAISIAVMMRPDPIVWIVTADYQLVSCTLDVKNGIIAWSPHPMASRSVESVAVVPGADGDELWLSVLQGSARTIEHLSLADLVATEQEDFHYVDCGLVKTYGSPTNTVTGLSHLEGLRVAAWADGAVLSPATVASGSVTFDTTFSKIHIGLPIVSEIETLRPETPANGTSQGKQKQILDAKLRLYRSMGGEVKSRLGNDVKILYWVSGEYYWGDVLDLYTDTASLELGAALDPDATIVITHDDPAPFNLLALIYRVAIEEV